MMIGAGWAGGQRSSPEGCSDSRIGVMPRLVYPPTVVYSDVAVLD